MELIDLTRSIESQMMTYPSDRHADVDIEQLASIQTEGRETRKVCFGTHTGTHVDAPSHFIESGNGIDEVPLDYLMGPVKVIDYSHLNANDVVTQNSLEDVEIPRRMIFKFGWEDQWGDPDDFYWDYPYFSEGAAEYLVENGLKLLGLDTPSPDGNSSVQEEGKDSPVHKILLENDTVIVEYLCNVDDIDESLNWNIGALPLKVKDADGIPARVVVWR